MDNRITQEEMIEMFGEEMPIEAARLFFEAPPEMTVAELRDKLRRLAKPDITDKMIEAGQKVADERLKLDGVRLSGCCIIEIYRAMRAARE